MPDGFYKSAFRHGIASSDPDLSEFSTDEASNNPLFNVGRFLSRPYFAVTSLLAGDPMDAMENLFQMGLDFPTGGFLNRHLSLANLLPDSVLDEPGDITGRHERREATDLIAGYGGPRFGGMSGLGVDVGLGIALDPLTYATFGMSAIAKGALQGSRRVASGMRVAEELAKTAQGAAALRRGGEKVLATMRARRFGPLAVDNVDDLLATHQGRVRAAEQVFGEGLGKTDFKFNPKSEVQDAGIRALEASGLINEHGAIRVAGYKIGNTSALKGIFLPGLVMPGLANIAADGISKAFPHSPIAAARASGEEALAWLKRNMFDKRRDGRVNTGTQRGAMDIGYQRAAMEFDTYATVPKNYEGIGNDALTALGRRLDDIGEEAQFKDFGLIDPPDLPPTVGPSSPPPPTGGPPLPHGPFRQAPELSPMSDADNLRGRMAGHGFHTETRLGESQIEAPFSSAGVHGDVAEYQALRAENAKTIDQLEIERDVASAEARRWEGLAEERQAEFYRRSHPEIDNDYEDAHAFYENYPEPPAAGLTDRDRTLIEALDSLSDERRGVTRQLEVAEEALLSLESKAGLGLGRAVKSPSHQRSYRDYARETGGRDWQSKKVGQDGGREVRREAAAARREVARLTHELETVNLRHKRVLHELEGEPPWSHPDQWEGDRVDRLRKMAARNMHADVGPEKTTRLSLDDMPGGVGHSADTNRNRLDFRATPRIFGSPLRVSPVGSERSAIHARQAADEAADRATRANEEIHLEREMPHGREDELVDRLGSLPDDVRPARPSDPPSMGGPPPPRAPGGAPPEPPPPPRPTRRTKAAEYKFRKLWIKERKRAVYRSVSEEFGVPQSRISEAMASYDTSMDRIRKELIRLGVWKKGDGRRYYIPHQAQRHINELITAAQWGAEARTGLKDVFTKRREQGMTTASWIEAVRHKAAEAAGVHSDALVDANAEWNIGILHLNRELAHNRTVYAQRLRKLIDRNYGEIHDKGRAKKSRLARAKALEVGYENLSPEMKSNWTRQSGKWSKNAQAYLEGQLEILEPREGALRFLGGGLKVVNIPVGMTPAQTMVAAKNGGWVSKFVPEKPKRMVADEHGNLKIAGKATWHQKVRGQNRWIKALLTSFPTNAAFHVRNDVASMLQAGLHPDVGIREGFKAMLQTFRKVPILNVLSKWAPSDAAKFLDAMDGNADALAMVTGMEKIGNTPPEVALQYLKGMLGRRSNRSDLMEDIRLGIGERSERDANAFEWLLEKGEAIGDVVENTHRAHAFLTLLKKGKSPGEAATAVEDMYVRYAINSGTERALRDVFIFARFMIGSAAWVPEMLSIPGKSGFTAAARVMGSQGGGATPEQVKGTLGLPMGEEGGYSRFMTSAGTPYEAAFSLGSPKQTVLGGMHPWVRWPIEQVVGESFRFGTKTGSYRRSPALLRMLDDMGLEVGVTRVTRKDGTERVEVEGWINEVLQLNPASRQMGLLNLALDERKSTGEKLLQGTTGARFLRVDTRNARIAMLSKFLEGAAEGVDPAKLRRAEKMLKRLRRERRAEKKKRKKDK